MSHNLFPDEDLPKGKVPPSVEDTEAYLGSIEPDAIDPDFPSSPGAPPEPPQPPPAVEPVETPPSTPAEPNPPDPSEPDPFELSTENLAAGEVDDRPPLTD